MSGLVALYHPAGRLAEPSSLEKIGLPGQIRSSVNGTLDRHEGGLHHAQEMVHARRDPAPSADG